jgi:hypothetical protein
MILFSRRTLAILAISTVACGGSKTLTSTDTPTGTDVPKRCRQYASAATSESASGTSFGTFTSNQSETCTFDSGARALRCTGSITGGGCTNISKTTTYASVADFIEEAEVVGRERYLTAEITQSGDCTGSTARHVYTFDEQKRPLSHQTDNAGSVSSTTYTAWDSLGRPTQQSGTIGGNCGTLTTTTTYDDAGRSVSSESLSNCGGKSHLTLTYDASGNVVYLLWTSGTSSSFSTVTTVTATAEVCL